MWTVYTLSHDGKELQFQFGMPEDASQPPSSLIGRTTIEPASAGLSPGIIPSGDEREATTMTDKPQHSRAAALSAAQIVIEAIRPHCRRIEIAGSLRRGKTAVGDAEVVAELAPTRDMFGERYEPEAIVRVLRALAGWTWVRGGDRYIQVRSPNGIPVDVFLVHPPAQWGVILAIRTGPAEFSHRCVAELRRHGLRTEDGRVLDGRGAVVPCNSEVEFFDLCRMPFIPPTDRR